MQDANRTGEWYGTNLSMPTRGNPEKFMNRSASVRPSYCERVYKVIRGRR